MGRKFLSKTSLLVYVFFFFHPAYPESPEKPFVQCTLIGQFGNQMHQIATTLAYAWDHDMNPIFPDLLKNDYNIPMNYKRVFFRLNASPSPRPVLNSFEQGLGVVFQKAQIPVKPDIQLKGFYQCWKNYHKYREKILDLFTPSESELKLIRTKHAQLLDHPYTVGVHVRTFHKECSNFIPFVGLAYYEQAMRLFPSNALFVVFSDRINWCKHHFAKFNRAMIFIEKQDHIEDFFLMSMLKHNIIGNSSYSWWAAYLNQSANQIVVAPSHFIHPNVSLPSNANMPNWITLNIDYDYHNAPYPADIRAYDAFSTSIDTQ